jgi:hypothetical protein
MMSDRRYSSVARFNDSCNEREKIVMMKSSMAKPGDFIRFRHILLD